MRKTFLLSLLILSFNAISFSKTIDIREAIQSGLIRVVPFGNGGHTERCLQLNFENLQKKNLEISIPAGLIFHTIDTSEQDLIIIQERLLVLEKFQKRSISFYAMCIQAGNASPMKDSPFKMGPEAEGNLLKLVHFIDEKNIRTDAAQYAIWAVTDDKRIENIGHPELAIFTAELLGKPTPDYYIRHAAESQPGQRAFQDRPAVIDGIFKYESDMDRKVSFGLYDAAGTLLHEGFADQFQKKGSHKFKFRFEVRHIPQGQYFARLMSEGKVIAELAVEF